MKTLEQAIVNDIIADLTNRKGLGNEWEEIDGQTRSSIKAKWADIVRKHLTSAGPYAKAEPK